MTWNVSADPVDFDEAIAWFRKRVKVTRSEWDAMTAAARYRAFVVSNVAQLDLVHDVWKALDAAIEKGTTLDDFRRDVAAKLRKAWAGDVDDPAWRLETIFRTNVQNAYSAGRYRQATDPDVLDDRPIWMFDAILDGRVTEVCAACDGTRLPASHEFWKTHNPPLHFNAATADTPVRTSDGEIPIGDVRPGMRVVTHTGQLRRVTASMHKIVRARRVRSLHLSSGRTLRVTDEHPILVDAGVEGLRWRQAADIEIGDSLFQYVDEVAGSPRVVARDPNDAPSLLDEPGVTRSVVSGSLGGRMRLSVDLDGNLRVEESQIEHEPSDGVLGDGATGEEREEVLLRWGEFALHALSKTSRGSHSGLMVEHRVGCPHATSGIGATNPEGPMVGAGPLRNDGRFTVRDADLLLLRPDLDAVPPAPAGERRLSETKSPLNVANASASGDVLGLDENIDGGPIPKVEWHSSTVVTIADERYDGELCDLSVEDDESYVAGGIIVHNCRSSLITMTEEEAGTLSKAPDVEVPKGFGATPSFEEDGITAWSADKLAAAPGPLARHAADGGGSPPSGGGSGNGDGRPKKPKPPWHTNGEKRPAGAVEERGRKFKAPERKIADYLAADGNDVAALPEPAGRGRKADAAVNGRPVEFKSPTTTGYRTTLNACREATRGGAQAPSVVIDVRGREATEAEARAGVDAARPRMKNRLDHVRVIGDTFDVTITELDTP